MAEQMALSAPTHLNRGLFSDYYLNEVVPTMAEWQSPTLHAQARDLRAELAAMLAQIQPEKLDEAQLEEQWVKPVLEKLGHHFSVQVKIRYRDGFRKPDYVFTADAEAARALTNQIYEPAQIAHALAVGDAKKWGVNLDQSSGKDGRNASQQIDEYLYHSELRWGILTDGRMWRLYEKQTSKHNEYYAVDLPALLNDKDQGAVSRFYYFYLFFRREAFDSWLDRVLKASEDYAEDLSERLEDEVYEALELIAQGFLDFRRNRLDVKKAGTLRTIYEESLVLLYRLLFIFYAESRDIFPLSENPEYATNVSLTAIKKKAATMVDFHPTSLRLLVDKDDFYNDLSFLFFIIDSGSADFNVPPYNGRLFSEPDHAFLTDHKVGDSTMAKALDKLARVPDRNRPEKRVFVDYRDLNVRHLGAIYEKLLEYELVVAEEALDLSAGKYIAAKDPKKALKKKGEVYLRTGSNERKVTGSYYTPDTIVSFIVKHTLEPLLMDVTCQYAALDENGHWNVNDRDGLRRAILALNVLDPATGSGHFMVEAVHQIAKWLTGLNLQPADIEAGEDELTYWKRQVVMSCIYGVDVNRLAVELAKVSLWLATLARGKPLSFLDHHVKHGNTLVGRPHPPAPSPFARSSHGEGEKDPSEGRQMVLSAEFAGAVKGAVGAMASIEATLAATVKDVKQQEKTFAAADSELEQFRTLANAETAKAFGAGAEANALNEQHRFLHFDLAFPEVFYDENGKALENGGFDAVIGNPPYVRQERIQPIKKYLEANYEIYSGTADLFLYFYERGLKLVKAGRRVGYITSGTYMNSNSAAAFRKFIRENAGFEKVVNFGENQPFKGAEMVYPTMVILKRGQAAPTFQSLFIEDVVRGAALDAAIEREMAETSSDVTGMDEWRFQPVELTRLFQKIMAGRQSLGDTVGGNLYRGVTTGFNDAFVIDDETRKRLIDEHPSSAEIIKPMLRGQDLRPWYQEKSGLHLIFTRRGINIENYPAVKAHLEHFRKLLEPKPDDWNDRTQGTWKGRKSGSYQWYEIQDNIAYYEEFDKTKIVWADISKIPRFSWNFGSYLNNTGFMIGDAKYSLLALLQSRVTWFAISQLAQPLRLRAGLWQYRVIPQFVERLPIPELSAAQESRLAELAEKITGNADHRYRFDEAMRRRIAADLGKGGKLNEALESWWELDFGQFRAEVKKAFKTDIPLKERGEWEAYLAAETFTHEEWTRNIVDLERELNAVVYGAFGLDEAEITLVEKVTKYGYGGV